MKGFVQIQANIFVEPCKDCGARPVIEQKKGTFIIRCPKHDNHYQTKPGLVDIADWNLKNKVHNSLGTKDVNPSKEAS